jgi:hypothetical protein
MNNLAKASVSRLLRQGLTKISPYPSEFTLSFVEDYCSEWDFKTDMAAQLATDFNQRPGFRNKASSDMLHDELVCSILPSSDIDRCEYFHGQTHLKMKDKFWISMLEKHSSLMENREHFDGNLDILVDLRGPSTSWWTSYRTNLYLEAIEATLTAKVSSMNAIFEKVNNLTMEQCRNILDDQGVQKVVEELLKTRSLIQNQTQQPEFQPLALLKAKILLSFMISDHPHSCRTPLSRPIPSTGR